jgi:hypothetical protein
MRHPPGRARARRTPQLTDALSKQHAECVRLQTLNARLQRRAAALEALVGAASEVVLALAVAASGTCDPAVAAAAAAAAAAEARAAAPAPAGGAPRLSATAAAAAADAAVDAGAAGAAPPAPQQQPAACPAHDATASAGAAAAAGTPPPPPLALLRDPRVLALSAGIRRLVAGCLPSNGAHAGGRPVGSYSALALVLSDANIAAARGLDAESALDTFTSFAMASGRGGRGAYGSRVALSLRDAAGTHPVGAAAVTPKLTLPSSPAPPPPRAGGAAAPDAAGARVRDRQPRRAAVGPPGVKPGLDVCRLVRRRGGERGRARVRVLRPRMERLAGAAPAGLPHASPHATHPCARAPAGRVWNQDAVAPLSTRNLLTRDGSQPPATHWVECVRALRPNAQQVRPGAARRQGARGAPAAALALAAPHSRPRGRGPGAAHESRHPLTPSDPLKTPTPQLVFLAEVRRAVRVQAAAIAAAWRQHAADLDAAVAGGSHARMAAALDGMGDALARWRVLATVQELCWVGNVSPQQMARLCVRAFPYAPSADAVLDHMLLAADAAAGSGGRGGGAAAAAPAPAGNAGMPPPSPAASAPPPKPPQPVGTSAADALAAAAAAIAAADAAADAAAAGAAAAAAADASADAAARQSADATPEPGARG